jgi:hypothetical protein
MGRPASLIVNGGTNRPLTAALEDAGMVFGTLPENGSPGDRLQVLIRFRAVMIRLLMCTES